MNSDNLSPWMNYIQKLIHIAIGKRGQVNIIIAGKTGAGKSTLINTIFEENLTKTGVGRPITPEIKEWTKPGIPLTLIDTKGLELDKYKKTVKDLVKEIKGKQKHQDVRQHIHIAWVCIEEPSGRVEEGHDKLVKVLNDFNIPVVVIITKSISSDETFINKAQELLPEARAVIPVLAEPWIMKGGHTVDPHGLPDLLFLTLQLVPEDVRDAFVASQRISVVLKQQRAHMVVVGSAITAGTTGLVPGVDIAGPISVQMIMIVGINVVWGVPPSVILIISLFFGTVVTTTATFGVWAMIIRWIPIVGALSVAVLAVVSTIVIGEAYITSLTVLNQRNPNRSPSKEEIKKQYLGNQLPQSLEIGEMVEIISRYLEMEEVIERFPQGIVKELRKFIHERKSGSSRPEKEE